MELEINNLSVFFDMYGKKKNVNVISDLSLKARKGEILAVVGASGSGKSVLAHAIMGILPKNAVVTGDIYYRGEKITENTIKEMRGKNISLVPQSTSYLDPIMKVGSQVALGKNESFVKKKKKAFKKYDLSEADENLYPFQYSGGMIRRALLSTVEQTEPTVIIADEPTPGLDRDLAYKTLRYFRDFADKGKAVIIITHDIDIASEYADRLAVFYSGTIVEITKAENFLKGEKYLKHPYTKALFKSLPQNGFVVESGVNPFLGQFKSKCVYFDKCQKACEKCSLDIPVWNFPDDSGFVRCVYEA